MPGGAPVNNTNAARGNKATRALELALAVRDGDKSIDNIAEGNGMKALVKLWLKQIDDAEAEGDVAKMKLITERLDGRPRQAMDIGGQEDNQLVVQIVKQGE